MAEVGSIEFIVSADLSRLLKAEQAISNSASSIESSLGKIDSTVNKLNKSTRDLSDKTGRSFKRTAEEAVSMETKTSVAAKEIQSSLDSASESSKDLGQKTSKSASEMSTAFKKAGDDADKLSKEITTSSNESSRAITRAKDSAKQLNTQMTKTAAGVKTATSGMDRLRGAAGNVGFQIQDMAVQLQSGTNAMVVFGQQGSQIAGAFGPGGAIFGAVIAIAAAIGTTLVGSMADAGDQIDIMTDKTEELTAAQREYVNLKLGEKLADISEQIAIMKNRLATLANIEARRGKLSKGQQEDLIELRAEYDLLIQTQTKYQDQVDKVSGKQQENQDQIKKTRDVIADLSGEYRVLALQVLGATEEANRLADNLTAQALLGEGATKQGLQEVVAGLQAIRVEREKLEAQEEAAQAKKKAMSFATGIAKRGQTPEQRRIDDLQRLNEARMQDLISEQAYVDAVNAINADRHAKRMQEVEAEYRARSEANNFLLNSVESLGQASANIIQGLINKTMTAKEAFYQLGSVILNEAIKSIVQLGVEHVKSILIGQTAGAAATAATVAQAATAAAAWAPAAAAASLATLGTNAAPAAAALASTNALASTLAVAGGRRYGGPVSAGRMYEVNEGGRPEMLTMGNKQYLMPSASGKVTSNRDMMQGGGVVNNINITTPPGMSADTRSTPNASGGQDIDVMISAVAQDIEGRGRVHSAITRATTAGNRQ